MTPPLRKGLLWFLGLMLGCGVVLLAWLGPVPSVFEGLAGASIISGLLGFVVYHEENRVREHSSDHP